MNDLIPAAVVLAGPLLLLAPIVYALRPQAGRHGSLRVPDWLGPYDLRVRQAVRHFADKQREPGLGDGAIVPPSYATADRDMTGSFPVVRAA